METVASVIPPESRADEDPSAVELNLECAIHCLDWSKDGSLVFGHDLGVGLLDHVANSNSTLPTEIQRQWTMKKRHIHLGKRADLVRTRGNTVAVAHSDYSITVLQDQDRMTQLGGTRGHSDFINGIDISSEGVIASTGDDRYVLVWEDSIPKSFRLANTGKKIKFWHDADSDRLVILEAGDKLRVLDWRRDQWLFTIYPGMPVLDFGVYGGDLIVIGEGKWKRYSIESLVGGCGYTPPTDEGRLTTNGKDGIAIFDNAHVAYATSNGVNLFDLHSNSENGNNLPYRNRQVRALAVKQEGDAVAVASGQSLLIFSSKPKVEYV